jgi:hypothetical protein
VGITGEAERKEGLVAAPLCRRRDLAYEVCVQMLYRDRGRKSVLTERNAEPCVVIDETGAIEIHPDGHYEMVMVDDIDAERWWFIAEDPQTPPDWTPCALLGSRGIPTRAALLGFKISFRYRAGVIEEAERVSASDVWCARCAPTVSAPVRARHPSCSSCARQPRIPCG